MQSNYQTRIHTDFHECFFSQNQKIKGTQTPFTFLPHSKQFPNTQKLTTLVLAAPSHFIVEQGIPMTKPLGNLSFLCMFYYFVSCPRLKHFTFFPQINLKSMDLTIIWTIRAFALRMFQSFEYGKHPRSMVNTILLYSFFIIRFF